jgi:hypothetical protein
MKLEKTKVLTIAVVTLVILNAFTLATIWANKPLGLSFPPPDPPKPSEFIIEKLGFDKEQAAAFTQLFDAHISEIKQLRENIRADKETLFENMKTEINDSAKVFGRIASIMMNEEKIQRKIYAHFKAVREICHEDQKQKFDIIIGDVMRIATNPRIHGQRPGAAAPPPLP